ncbi:MAG: ABC transporter permease [Pseudomonadota bacterium]
MLTRIAALIVKEFLAALRDRRSRFALMVPPFLQLLLYAYAATLEVKNVPIGILNEDWGMASQRLVSRFERASAFSEIVHFHHISEVAPAIDSQQVMVVVHIGQDFSRRFEAGEPAEVQIILDARKSNSAQIVNGYIDAIVNQFNQDRIDLAGGREPVSTVVDRTWYNPNREYRNVMIPSLVGTLSMATVLIVVAMSVARERELGTFEQLLVSPLQPLEIVIGKAVPGVAIGMVQAVVIVGVITTLFGIPLTGSPLLLFGGLFVFLLAIAGAGLFISSLAHTQQQAMLGSMLFMAPAIMLSGFSAPVQNMPNWLKPLAYADPLTHFLVIVRGVFLRDMAAHLVADRVWPMALIAGITLTAAAWLFRRSVQ